MFRLHVYTLHIESVKIKYFDSKIDQILNKPEFIFFSTKISLCQKIFSLNELPRINFRELSFRNERKR